MLEFLCNEIIILALRNHQDLHVHITHTLRKKVFPDGSQAEINQYTRLRGLSQLMDTSNLTHIMDTPLFNQYEYVLGHCFETIIQIDQY